MERVISPKVEIKLVHVAIATATLTFSVIGWTYQTFVTIRERDMVKGIFEERLRSIESKQDQTNEKLDNLISSFIETRE